MIENLHLKFTTLREIILELARRLDEEQICKQETYLSDYQRNIKREDI